MHVLNTTSPVATAAPRGAPKSQPSKTAPVSRASRPRTGGGALERSSANGCSLRVRGGEPLIIAEVGKPTLDEGEQDAAAHGRAEKRSVARQRAHRPLADDPLRLGIDHGERCP